MANPSLQGTRRKRRAPELSRQNASAPMSLVQPINHRDLAVAQEIHALLVLAHAQEARVLRVGQFVALERTAEDIQSSADWFLGARQDSCLVGVLSLRADDEPGQVNIGVLVVLPSAQRQGIGRSLVVAALRSDEGATFSVTAGASNAAALALYGALGFGVYRHGVVGPEALPMVKLRRAGGRESQHQDNRCHAP